MLPRINSIKSQRDFGAIFRKAKSLKNNLFVLKIAKNELGINRFGFVVSQKVSKKATIRNKVKRRLSEAARGEIRNIRSGTDVVLIALPGIEKKEFFEIKKTLNEALVKVKCLNS